MQLFRKKLSQEVKEAESWLANMPGPRQEVQANIYCIAALLRKIMTRFDTPKSWKIKTNVRGRSGYKPQIVPLLELCERISHYAEFQPTNHFTAVVRLKSDLGSEPVRREVDLLDFLEHARAIASEPNDIAYSVIRQVKQHLGVVAHKENLDARFATEAAESLVDGFDIIRETGATQRIDGSLQIFRTRDTISNGNIEREYAPAQLPYDFITEHVFVDWNFTSFPQFRTAETFSKGLASTDRIVHIETYGRGLKDEFFAVRAVDLSDMMHAAEQVV